MSSHIFEEKNVFKFITSIKILSIYYVIQLSDVEEMDMYVMVLKTALFICALEEIDVLYSYGSRR